MKVKNDQLVVSLASFAQELLKVFFAGCSARFDHYRAIAGLARHMTTWAPCLQYKVPPNDVMRERIPSSPPDRMVWDDALVLDMHYYADTDYGTNGGTSTSGVQTQFEEPSTFFPISSASTGQTAVSHSTRKQTRLLSHTH